MEREDRNKIDRCLDAMVKILDMTILWPLLLRYGIYNKDHINVSVWEQTLNNTDTNKDILLTIKTRGPHAYQNLIKCLRHANYNNLIEMLENPQLPSVNNNTSNEIDSRQNGFHCIDDETDPLTLYNPSQAEGPVKIVVQKSEIFRDRSENQVIATYPMRTKIRGLVLIITLIDYVVDTVRASAEHDEKTLIDLFQQMGFEIFPHRNLTVSEIRETIQNFARNKKFRNVDSSFVIISGHGTRLENESQTVIKDKYEQLITVGEILSYFAAEKCPSLINKPKIFIFQVCRGKKSQNSIQVNGINRNAIGKPMFEFDGENSESTQSSIPGNLSVRNYADILIVQSTLPEHVSFRDKITGSWYIQLLCTIFMEYAHKLHIQDLLLKVDSCLQHLRNSYKHCQTSTVKTIGFSKHLYINPGLFEDDK